MPRLTPNTGLIMKVIINADDLGMDDLTNSEIFRLMSCNKITSSTMMANAPCIEEAVKQSKAYPQCSFGIHLNLTEFHPLTTEPGLDSLLDDNGCFKSQNENLKVTGITRKAIINELSTQISRLKSYGVNISHIDSHQHVHINPTMFPVIKYLQYKFNIKKIRLTRLYPDNGAYNFKMLSKKKLYNFALRNLITSQTTDGFSSLNGFVRNPDLIQAQCNTFEIMVHPGKNENEDKILNSSWEDTMPFTINHINYHSL